jgi:hypothetical protein
MNKNTRNRRSIARKNFHHGNKETVFDISTTMPNSSNLGVRKYTISIGYAKRKSQNPKVANGNRQTSVSQPE